MRKLETALHQLARDPNARFDLAEVALQLAADEYHRLDIEGFLSELDAMAHEARAYLRGSLEKRVEGLCRYLFHDMGFRGNTKNYYDPRNSYLNQVLERRTGIPITLAAVAMAVGTRAGLEVAGIGLPGHFVAQATLGDRSMLFDPFHGGRRLSVPDCENLVFQVTREPFQMAAADLEPMPLGLIVLRMLNNLKACYLKKEDFRRGARVTQRLRQLDPHNPLQERDLGVCLLRSDQPGRAIDHLMGYLAGSPDAADAATVRQLVDQARSQVARWN